MRGYPTLLLRMIRANPIPISVVLALTTAGCDAPPTVPVVDPPLFSATTETSSVRVPIDIAVFVPCALDGAGEIVTLSGRLRGLFHLTLDAGGGGHIVFSSNPQGVSGVGETSGERYRGTGISRQTHNFIGLPFSDTFVNDFRIIGQGAGNNLLIHSNLHLTINANGEITTFVDNFRAECK